MRVSIIGSNLPGRTFCRPDGSLLNNVHVGIQRQRDPVSLVPADAPEARWDFDVDVVNRGESFDFKGPEIQGKPGERFVYLTWGQVQGSADHFEMFRRAKLMLNRVERDLIDSVRTSGWLIANVDLSDQRGGPRCARVDPPAVTWAIA
jgi:hypothetical protein